MKTVRQQMHACLTCGILTSNPKYCSRKCHYKDATIHAQRSCPICKTELRREQLSSSQKCCSHSCRSEAARKQRAVRECITCGKPFQVIPSHFKYGDPKYCSRKCLREHKDVTRANRECEICGTPFHAFPSEIKSGFGRFCSRACFGKQHSVTLSGANSVLWKGGISFEPYGAGFNNDIRKKIRDRDNHQCVLCQCAEKDIKRKLSVHHIDYDKENNHLWNLISLCIRCHVGTSHHRVAWAEFFRIVNDERGFKPEVVRKQTASVG